MPRKTITTGSPWEPIIGYARAVRVGNHVSVSGTTAIDPLGKIVGKGDAYVQTKQIFRNIESALRASGAEIEDVVRTRMYITDISVWQDVGRAHSEVFGEILPASTLVEISRLINPDMLVEIEVEAFIEEED